MLTKEYDSLFDYDITHQEQEALEDAVGKLVRLQNKEKNKITFLFYDPERKKFFVDAHSSYWEFCAKCKNSIRIACLEWSWLNEEFTKVKEEAPFMTIEKFLSYNTLYYALHNLQRYKFIEKQENLL